MKFILAFLLHFIVFGVVWTTMAFIGEQVIQINAFGWIMVWGVVTSVPCARVADVVVRASL